MLGILQEILFDDVIGSEVIEDKNSPAWNTCLFYEMPSERPMVVDDTKIRSYNENH